MEILELADKAARKSLCDHCLGRLFGKRGHGLSNEERGITLRMVLIANKEKEGELDDVVNLEPPETCWLCENLFDELGNFSELIIEELQPYEYDTFLIGSKIDAEIVEKEEILWGETSLEFCEPIKAEVNREVGKLVDLKIDKEVDFERPDIVAVIDTSHDVVDLQISPLFIYGRYRKFQRGIPQTRWPFKTCWGKGCEKCNNTGKMYPISVEEIIAEEVMKSTKGEAHEFHGMGREDIDAVMLGNGRPFVLEIKKPIKRHIDLKELEDRINSNAKGKVEIEDLHFSSKKEVVSIKAAKPPKTYEVEVEFEDPIAESSLASACTALKGITIRQETPKRVSHRRAKKIRERKILEIGVKLIESRKASFMITSESGTYIKELIHGDEGRTQPNIADLLHTNCKVIALNVTRIHDNEDKTLQEIE
jgi:tRNA pseudouridine synthase 10